MGSLVWGWVSDVWGRRPVLLLGPLGSAFFQIVFGFRLIELCQFNFLIAIPFIVRTMRGHSRQGFCGAC